MLIVIITRTDLRDEIAMAADEAFALSPISARATLPSEADYDAIREAFMETARGRWFLGEYGKRNRNADTGMVLDAVARIEATIAGQKQTAANELPDALVLIRGLLSDAKAGANRTMSGSDAEEALAAINKGVRIIREISWTLREYGTDARICDMLDMQVSVIEGSHLRTIAPEKRDAVLATFDLLIRRIGELGGSSGAAPWSDAETMPSATGQDAPAATTAEAAPPAFETAPGSVSGPTALTGPDEVGMMMPETATQQNSAHNAFAQETPVQDNSVQEEASVLGTSVPDPAAHDPSSRETPGREPSGRDSSVHDTSADADDTLQTPSPSFPASAATLMISQAEVAPIEFSEQEAVATDSDATALDPETEHDLAVLDAIALEMAEPETAHANLAEPPHGVDAGTTETDTIEMDAIETGTIATDLAETGVADVAMAEIDIVSPVAIASVAVEAAPKTAMAVDPKPAPQVPSQPPSLGASLIASGIVSSRSAVHDVLAPLRRMSQAERIAFFS
jgi:hypothetical protein